MKNERPPRELAIRILTRVLSDGQPLDEALTELAANANPAGRAWLQEVCSGVFRWKGRLDLAIDSVALKKKPTGWLRKALLIAGYQLLVQDRTPPAWIVSETVDSIRAKEGDAPAKFGNALLRKLSEHAHHWRELPFPGEKDAAAGAAWASLPPWLWQKLVAERGLEWAKSYALASLERPSLWISARDSSFKPDWADAGPIKGSWKAKEGGFVPGKEGFADGQFIVQDISSQTLLNEIAEKMESENLKPLSALDLCSAPGGKAVGLSWRGFEVLASDRSEERLKLLRATLSRVPTASSVSIRNISRSKPEPQFSLVWVDAPCSGSGILRRHPDVRWLRKPDQLGSLTALQADVLRQGWEWVRPGGYLVYSVCSVLKEEGEAVFKSVGLKSQELKTWSLAPHEEPKGDGFWAKLVQKPLS